MKFIAKLYIILFLAFLFIVLLLLRILALSSSNIDCRYFNRIFEDQLNNFPWNRNGSRINDNEKSEIIPRPRSIFFVETSGASKLSANVACSIESAAKHHPNHYIYILMTFPFVEVDGVTRELVDRYSNIYMKYVNINTFLEGTPLHILWKESRLQTSEFVISHLSDILRYALIFRFGGTYVDTDVIFLKALPNEESIPNFVGKENEDLPHLAAGIFRFQYNHPVINKILEYLAAKFDGQDWGANGPKALTKVMNDLCNVNHADNMSPEKCLGIKVFSPSSFYKIPWRQWKDIFDDSKTDEIMLSLKDSFILHTWGRFSSNIPIVYHNKMSAFLKVASTNCPVAFRYLVG